MEISCSNRINFYTILEINLEYLVNIKILFDCSINVAK